MTSQLRSLGAAGGRLYKSAPGPALFRPALARPAIAAVGAQARRHASQGYGETQTTHAEHDNPKVHHEHPGPEAPETSSSSKDSTSSGGGGGGGGGNKGEAQPKFNTEKQDQSGEDVKRHNEEVANRAEKQA